PARPSVAVAPRKPAVKTDVEIDDEDERPRKGRARDLDDEDDEDDRPRKKAKGKKGKKTGPPGGLLIGGAGACVLLLGGTGCAIYWFGLREKPKDTASGTTSDSGGSGGGGGAKSGPPAGWVQYSPPSGGFRVYLPKAPLFTPPPVPPGPLTIP